MGARDFLIMVAVCAIWGLNNIVSKLVVSTWDVPPLFYASVRFALVLLLALPWVLPLPRPLWRIVMVGLCMGAGSFGLMFVGLTTSSPSAAAVVVQAGVPVTTLLSIVVLGERIHWRRWLGIALTLLGVLAVIWKPGFAVSTGLLFVFASAVTSSIGAILMKQMPGIAPLRFQAWVALSSFVALAAASAVGESGQWGAATAAGWPFVAAVVFSAAVVSVGAHTAYYGLIARHEANLIAPLTLMTPLATIALGVTITGDQLDAHMIAGTALALLGVLIIAVRRTGAPVVEAQQRA
ncbi:MAG: DMT family transporter [Sphingomonadales bacterium]|nr:DMT family transporter [Sphingomonadales bacterium]MDE2568545.1 DMT family transporter [Sphingomonadales bacterium]